jgi:hypothetical protein
LYIIPENCCRPIIANKAVRKIINAEEFASSGNDLSNIRTCFRIVGLAFKFLKGLITLKIRKALKLMPDAINSIALIEVILLNISYPATALIKSTIFQPYRKYENL